MNIDMDRIAFRRVALAASVVCALCASFGTADAARAADDDLVRFVQRDKNTGEYDEGTRSGTIESASKDGIKFRYKTKSGEEKTYDLSTAQIVWAQYGEEPLELAAARVESEVGNYAEALEKIDAIEKDDVRSDLVALEIEWARCFATMKLAQADPGENNVNLNAAVTMMKKFADAASDFYRYYDANALLGDAAIALGSLKAAEKYYAILENAEAESIKARGQVGLAQIALDSQDYEKARELFSAVAENEALDGMLDGLDARTCAKIGLSRALAAQEKIGEAIAGLTELLGATPNSATRQQALVYNALGDVYAAAERNEEAIVAYLHVDLLYPAARNERVKALKALAGLWERVGRTDRAAETKTILKERFNVEIE